MPAYQDTVKWESVRISFKGSLKTSNLCAIFRSVTLPVAALLKQYKEHPDAAMIRHFDLMFIQQSVGKLTTSVRNSPPSGLTAANDLVKEQMDLLPVLLHGLSMDSGKPTCATLFNLFLRLLPRLKIPARGSKDDTELREKLGLDMHSEDAEFVSTWFSRLILLTIIRPTAANVSKPLVPGLTTAEFDFLTLSGKAETWDPASTEGLNLTETKIGILNFLASGAFTDAERFMSALFASADTNSRISNIGDDLMKRTTVSLEDISLVRRLYETYFSVGPALQIRILSLLSKSAAATAYPADIIRLLQTGIQGNGDAAATVAGREALKYRTALFFFMNWVARMGSVNDLNQIAPPVVASLRSYIEQQGWPVPEDRSNDAAALRALAYEALGAMAKTSPSQCVQVPDLSLIKWLFRSLTEDGSFDTIVVSIEGALASLLTAFTLPLAPEVQHGLRSMLLDYMTLEQSDTVRRSARFSTVRWANRCLPYTDIVGRWIDILALGGRQDERSDVVEEGKKGLVSSETYGSLRPLTYFRIHTGILC